MTEEKPQGNKRVKLSTVELEKRNEWLQRLEETGVLDRLRTSFYARLMLQESWRDEMKETTRLAVKESGGISAFTMDELVAKLLPAAKSNVPTIIETEMKREIEEACQGKSMIS